MVYRVKTLNKIAPEGLNVFGAGYEISDGEEAPDAIIVRSANVETNKFGSLLAVARAGAGYNNITVEEATDKGICVFNTPGANANAVAELVFTMVGFAARNIGASLEFTRSLENESDDGTISQDVEANKSKFRGFELRGKVLGVVGLGKIGVIVANYGVGHGMRVQAYDPFPSAMNMHSLNSSVRMFSNLPEMMKGCDIISVHVPLSEDTKSLIGDKEIALLNADGILINLSRKGIIDDAAALAALEDGRLHRYVSDFPTRKLLGHSKVICIPHLGASTEESESNCATMAAQQIKDYLEFGNITNSVNFPAIQVPWQNNSKNRIVVINRDVPNMIAHITAAIGGGGLNIQGMVNESNGKIGYNIIDLPKECPPSVPDAINKIENVIRVRLIPR